MGNSASRLARATGASISLTFLLGAASCAWIRGDEVEIRGLSGLPKTNVRNYLGLTDLECETPESQVRLHYRRSDKEIQEALQAVGHYRPRIEKNVTFEDDCWLAEFDIDAGPAVHLKTVRIEVMGPAQQDPAFAQFIQAAPLRQGEVLRHDHYQQTKNGLGTLAAQKGYLDARFTEAALVVDPEQQTADVTLVLESGPRYRYGEVSIKQEGYAQGLVQRMITLEPGQLYDTKTILDQHRNLSGSGFFESALIQPRLDERAESIVPLSIRLQPRKRHSYSAGVGASTDTGPRFSLGYENRRLSPNGQSFTSGLTASVVESEVKAGYRIPLQKALTDSLGFDAGLRMEDTESVQSRTAALGAVHTLALPLDITGTRYLQLSREDFIVGDQNDIALLLMPGMTFSHKAADDLVHPKKGKRLRLELRGATEAVISDATFEQALTEGKWITSLPARLRLITRAQLGTTFLQSRFENLPASVRFFAGGDSSVRGFELDSLGPEDNDGDVIGGRHLIVGSVELERGVFENWGIAPFFDIGNAINSFHDPLAKGAGLGVRWRSPLGPVGIDLAHPLNESDEIVRLHLRFGPEL